MGSLAQPPPSRPRCPAGSSVTEHGLAISSDPKRRVASAPVWFLRPGIPVHGGGTRPRDLSDPVSGSSQIIPSWPRAASPCAVTGVPHFSIHICLVSRSRNSASSELRSSCRTAYGSNLGCFRMVEIYLTLDFAVQTPRARPSRRVNLSLRLSLEPARGQTHIQPSKRIRAGRGGYPSLLSGRPARRPCRRAFRRPRRRPPDVCTPGRAPPQWDAARARARHKPLRHSTAEVALNWYVTVVSRLSRNLLAEIKSLRT